MFTVSVKRTCELRAPYAFCLESQTDWTHFTHLHRRSHAGYRLLYKKDRRTMFLYKARCVHPLPWYNHFLVVRDDDPSGTAYRNIYVDVVSGATHYLYAHAVCNGETTSLIGEYVFSLPDYWRWFPRIFFWLFKRRMRTVMEEDNQWIGERMVLGDVTEGAACAPLIPESFDVFRDTVPSDGTLPTAERHFEDYAIETFDRWRA